MTNLYITLPKYFPRIGFGNIYILERTADFKRNAGASNLINRIAVPGISLQTSDLP